MLSLLLILACGSDPETGPDRTAVAPRSAPEAEQPVVKQRPPDRSHISVSEVPLPRINARHILVSWAYARRASDRVERSKTAAEALAAELLLQLDKGADFAVLAKRYSDDATAPRGGKLGVFTTGVMDPAFEKALLAIKPGERAPVVETPFGFHIIERLAVVEVHVAHVLVQWSGVKRSTVERSREDAEALAQEALAALAKGAPFETIARTYSDGPTRKRGGDLGWFQQGQMVPQFDDVAFALSPGQTSGVIESPAGLHIIRRIE